MTRKNSVLFIALALIASIAGAIAAAEEPYTAAEEEYMRKQAEKYYVPDNPFDEYMDPETGEIAWKAMPEELKKALGQKGNVSKGSLPQADHAATMAAKLERQETRRNIRSYGAAAAVDWGIPAMSIPAVEVQGTAGTVWGLPKSGNAPAVSYKVLSKGTEIRIALLTDRVDLPEGVIGHLTRPVYDAQGEEMFSQSAQIFGRYHYYDQAIVWDHVVLDGEVIKLENPNEFRTIIHLTERTEPGYKLSINIRNTILIKIPISRDKGAEYHHDR